MLSGALSLSRINGKARFKWAFLFIYKMFIVLNVQLLEGSYTMASNSVLYSDAKGKNWGISDFSDQVTKHGQNHLE